MGLLGTIFQPATNFFMLFFDLQLILYTFKFELETHMKVHKHEKPYIVTLCTLGLVGARVEVAIAVASCYC